jgi:integrase
MAADDPGKPSLRGDPGATAGLNRAIDWGLLDSNPAKCGIRNTPRRAREKLPFESWQQIEAIAAKLSPVYGPMVVFAAATGLRPSELFGLEPHDVDREAGVVYVRRAYANGRLKHTKTRLSNRAVPLQAKAFEALDRLPRSESEILFPNSGAESTSAASAAATGSPHSEPQAPSRCATCMTCATPTRPSCSAPAFRSSRSPASWARASR